MKRTMLQIGVPLCAGGFVFAIKFNAFVPGMVMAFIGLICVIYGMSGKNRH